jgi:uncharacterized RDD family membrane protein YckC
MGLAMAQVEPARMVTPEAVALEFRTANLGSRILAFLIDMVVVVAGILAGAFAVALLGEASDVVVPDWVAVTIVLVLIPGWWLGYFIAFETLWRGRTLGKAALGLRVVTKEGAPVRFRHAAIRALLGLVDWFVLSGFFAVVFILFTRDNQRLGDLVAGTLVLRERSALAPPAPVVFGPPPGLESYTSTLDVGGLGTEEYLAVRTYLLRAASLPPGPRSALALQLANPLAARLRPPPPAGVSPELYLHCVAAAYQQRQRLAARQGPGPGPGSGAGGLEAGGLEAGGLEAGGLEAGGLEVGGLWTAADALSPAGLPSRAGAPQSGGSGSGLSGSGAGVPGPWPAAAPVTALAPPGAGPAPLEAEAAPLPEPGGFVPPG